MFEDTKGVFCIYRLFKKRFATAFKAWFIQDSLLFRAQFTDYTVLN